MAAFNVETGFFSYSEWRGPNVRRGQRFYVDLQVSKRAFRRIAKSPGKL